VAVRENFISLATIQGYLWPFGKKSSFPPQIQLFCGRLAENPQIGHKKGGLMANRL